MCTTKLKRGFRALFDQTIHEYANGLRMDYAGELLKNRDIPIAEVAEKLGYKYQNSFTVAFKQHTGLLPKEYRRLAFHRPVSPGNQSMAGYSGAQRPGGLSVYRPKAGGWLHRWIACIAWCRVAGTLTGCGNQK